MINEEKILEKLFSEGQNAIQNGFGYALGDIEDDISLGWVTEAICRTYPTETTMKWIAHYTGYAIKNWDKGLISKKADAQGGDVIAVKIFEVFPNYNDIFNNLKQGMSLCGWNLAKVERHKSKVFNNGKELFYDEYLYVPKFPTQEFGYKNKKFVYHVTPSDKSAKIVGDNSMSKLGMGLTPRASYSEVEDFIFTHRVHCFTELVSDDEFKSVAEKLEAHRFVYSNKKTKDKKVYLIYDVLKIDVGALPQDMVFYPDHSYKNGAYTVGNIPPQAITKFKQIQLDVNRVGAYIKYLNSNKNKK